VGDRLLKAEAQTKNHSLTVKLNLKKMTRYVKTRLFYVVDVYPITAFERFLCIVPKLTARWCDGTFPMAFLS
jgi:hypothetical protein